eukprot:3084407-Prymnesium_polylepis.1
MAAARRLCGCGCVGIATCLAAVILADGLRPLAGGAASNVQHPSSMTAPSGGECCAFMSSVSRCGASLPSGYETL